MPNSRKKYTNNQQLILFEQVNGCCPICGQSLMYKKANKDFKNFEIAHIYPLNPTISEIEELKGVEKLDSDVNSLKNVIAVCPGCHSKFDKPRKKYEYKKWFDIKKRIQEDSEVKDMLKDFVIEEDIIIVIKKLNGNDIESELIELTYKSLKIDDKMDDTIPFIIKQSIKSDVVYYFEFIKYCFKDIDKTVPNKFETLASQVKSTYLKLSQTISEQDIIFKALVNWLDEKSDKYSKRACEIIISFFIQNCEIFKAIKEESDDVPE